MLASRLAENTNTSVLLLEAGPDYPDPVNLPDEIKFGHTSFAESPASEHNWALRGTITGEQGEIHVARGKVMGGGSSINGQAMQRGLPEDFDSWSAMGNDEWSYDKVLPYFRKSEHDLDIRDDFHGTDGPMPVRGRLPVRWGRSYIPSFRCYQGYYLLLRRFWPISVFPSQPVLAARYPAPATTNPASNTNRSAMSPLQNGISATSKLQPRDEAIGGATARAMTTPLAYPIRAIAHSLLHFNAESPSTAGGKVPASLSYTKGQTWTCPH